MKKQELIDDTAARCGRSKTLVREVFDAAADATRAAIGRGDDVFLLGLGKLSTKQRGERQARDMHKGTAVTVPPRTVVAFRPSDSLAEAANAPR